MKRVKSIVAMLLSMVMLLSTTIMTFADSSILLLTIFAYFTINRFYLPISKRLHRHKKVPLDLQKTVHKRHNPPAPKPNQ